MNEFFIDVYRQYGIAFDFDNEGNPRFCPIEYLSQGRNALAVKPRIEFYAGVELLDLSDSEIPDQSLAIACPRNVRVVHDNQFAVAAQVYIELDEIHTLLYREGKGNHRVLRCISHRAAMSHYEDLAVSSCVQSQHCCCLI